MKILYITTVGSTMGFFKNLIKELVDKGDVVDIATNERISKVPNYYREWGCKVFNISTSRSPFRFGNLKAINQIRKLAIDYDIVHCHTPLAGMAARFACRKLRKKGLKVVYTAHGFHFYKGAPFKNWLLYYPIEKICSKWTDCLITINAEDYSIASKKMKAGKNVLVHGVGINVDSFSSIRVDQAKKRAEIGVPLESKMVLSVGELNDNKNHIIVIKALSKIADSNIHYVIAGQGEKAKYLLKTANRLKVNLHLLGFRKDVAELYKASDLFVHPSLREGLPVSVIEAIASGLDCVCSNIRGCRDLITNNLFNPKNEDELANLIKIHLRNKENPAVNKSNLYLFDEKTITKTMIDIYSYLS